LLTIEVSEKLSRTAVAYLQIEIFSPSLPTSFQSQRIFSNSRSNKETSLEKRQKLPVPPQDYLLMKRIEECGSTRKNLEINVDIAIVIHENYSKFFFLPEGSSSTACQ